MDVETSNGKSGLKTVRTFFSSRRMRQKRDGRYINVSFVRIRGKTNRDKKMGRKKELNKSFYLDKVSGLPPTKR